MSDQVAFCLFTHDDIFNSVLNSKNIDKYKLDKYLIYRTFKIRTNLYRLFYSSGECDLVLCVLNLLNVLFIF